MNFFDHQDQARRASRRLIFLFVLAVLSLIMATTVLIFLLFAAGEAAEPDLSPTVLFSDVFIAVSLGVVAVVALGSLFRLMQLRGGGKVVAESLGGKLINPASTDPDERRVLNVVEEMAIASGTPVPPVYLLEDEGINAFAAGYQPEDAVIGVTRGCIRLLSRDELQGVMAHEFSHIVHGDMRINIRLMGVVFGIMVLGIIGYQLLRGGMLAGHRSRDNRGGALVFLGLGLVVIGYAGVFFGNLIKAAVSRQREFLADASAVQFTRNPDGIGGALKKIAGHTEGSRIRSADTSEVSHMLFEEGGASRLSTLFATHPPVNERIRRIHPDWRPPAGKSGRKAAASSASAAPQAAGFAAGHEAVMSSIGNPGPAHVAMAREQLSALPALLREAAHDSSAVVPLLFALVISRSPSSARAQQDTWLRGVLNDEAVQRQYPALLTALVELRPDLALVLAELSLPALKQLSAPQQQRFLQQLGQLLQLDGEISLFEWCLFKLVQQGLQAPSRARMSLRLHNARQEALVVLSMLAQAGHDEADHASSALQASLRSLGWSEGTLLPVDQESLKRLNNAMRRLRELLPEDKEKLLHAMLCCVEHDGQIRVEEADLLRALCSLLGCPVPPLKIDMLSA